MKYTHNFDAPGKTRNFIVDAVTHALTVNFFYSSLLLPSGSTMAAGYAGLNKGIELFMLTMNVIYLKTFKSHPSILNIIPSIPTSTSQHKPISTNRKTSYPDYRFLAHPGTPNAEIYNII